MHRLIAKRTGASRSKRLTCWRLVDGWLYGSSTSTRRTSRHRPRPRLLARTLHDATRRAGQLPKNLVARDSVDQPHATATAASSAACTSASHLRPGVATPAPLHDDTNGFNGELGSGWRVGGSEIHGHESIYGDQIGARTAGARRGKGGSHRGTTRTERTEEVPVWRRAGERRIRDHVANHE